MSNEVNDRANGSIVPSKGPDYTDVIVRWIGAVAHYRSIKEFLENKYRSPANLHEAHSNVIKELDLILKEQRIIAQAMERLREKESSIAELLDSIEVPYPKPSLEEQEKLDPVIRGYSSVGKDRNPYEEVALSAELISAYMLEKLYLSFVSEVEVKPASTNNNSINTLDMLMFTGMKTTDSNEAVPKELCKDIYSDYLSGIRLPLPSLETFIFVEGRVVEGKPINELKLLGLPNTRESSLVNTWKYTKGPYKAWISSMISSLSGKALAYYTIVGKEEDKVSAILSKINRS